MPIAETQSIESTTLTLPYAGARPAEKCAVGSYRLLGRGRNQLAQFPFDAAALTLVWLAAPEARISLEWSAPFVLDGAGPRSWEAPLGCFLALWAAAALYMRIYHAREPLTAWAIGRGVAETSLLGTTAAIVTTFLYQPFDAELSRSFALMFAVTSAAAIGAARCAGIGLRSILERIRPSPERVAVIGPPDEAGRMARRLARAGGGAESVEGIIVPRGESGPVKDRAVLGRLDQLGAVINRFALDRLVVLEGHLDHHALDECARTACRMGVAFARVLETFPRGAAVECRDYDGIRVLETRPLTIEGREQLTKRVLDVAGSTALLALLSPLMIAVAALVKLTSPGPVAYRAKRVGLGGRHFTFLKFRTMYHVAGSRSTVQNLNEHSGPLFKIRGDPRVTPLGRLLRRYSLDELPQLINVLRGEMSLVGPRPLPAEDLDPDGQSRQFAVWAEQRSHAPGGITGLWQVSGRSELPFDKMVELDLAYVRNPSLIADIKILLRTPLCVLTGRGAY